MMDNKGGVLYPNVSLGKDVVLSYFVIIGEPPQGTVSGELSTIIDSRAIIRSHTVIYAGNRIGKDFQTDHGVMVREQDEIGDQVSVGAHSIIGHRVKLGHGVRIYSNVFIPEYSVLEEGAWWEPGVAFTNAL
jgi:UDP-3-O-[3-hydroxymyristoyl] glucosamine N-acyltransferase